MKKHSMLGYRTWLSGLGLLSALARAQEDGLFQTYCSNENTGSSYQAVTNMYNSNGACHDQCLSKYAFAIVQYQRCWCSNYAPAAQQNTGNCNQPCPGFKTDLCGNQDNGLFGYIALNVKPSGTAGGSSSQTSTSSYSSTSDVSTPIVQTVTESQSLSVSVSYSYITPTSSTKTQATASVSSQEPVTSVQVVTLSGATVTQTVTSTPMVPGESSSQPSAVSRRRDGLSGGAIAGIVIGALAGAALLALAAFLLWYRRRNSDDDENGSGRHPRIPGRNISVLSRAGLTRQRPAMAERDDEPTAATGTNSVRHSMLFGPGSEVSPVSPLGSTHDDSRRHSKPFVYDQRLNPSALFANQEATGSRVSMQDTQDYSRPLGITNPDPRASFDSRISHQ